MVIYNLTKYEELLEAFKDREKSVASLKSQLAEAREGSKRNYDKWWGMEQEHIIPLFNYAKTIGFDLQQLVYDNPGKNCSQLFFEKVIALINQPMKDSDCYCELGDHFASRELMKESECECESLGFEIVDELNLIHLSFDGKWEKEALENLAKKDAKKKYEVTIDMFGETKHITLQDFINGLKKSHFTI